jgi:hypothetical protein
LRGRFQGFLKNVDFFNPLWYLEHEDFRSATTDTREKVRFRGDEARLPDGRQVS